MKNPIIKYEVTERYCECKNDTMGPCVQVTVDLRNGVKGEIHQCVYCGKYRMRANHGDAFITDLLLTFARHATLMTLHEYSSCETDLF